MIRNIKNNLNYILFFIVVPLVFIGCETIAEKLNLTQPEILSVTPGQSAQNVAVDTTVVIEFDKKMDTIQVNECFSLSSDSTGDVEGAFTWDNHDKRMTFTPKKALSGTSKFTIVLDAEAEDTEGNDIGEDFKSSFYLNQDNEKPEITDVNLSYTDEFSIVTTYDLSVSTIGINPDSVIHFTFSEAIDIDSLFDGISISPSVEGSFSWNTAQDLVTFVPNNSLAYGTTYSVTVNESITDSNLNVLKESKNYSFTVGDDFVQPELLSAYQTDVSDVAITANWVENTLNSGAEKDGIITLEFSEDVLLKTIKDAVSISPSANFYVSGNDSDNRMKIIFEDDLLPETEYKVTISTSITDLQNNNLNREYIYRFNTDGTNSLCPTIFQIDDPNSGSTWVHGDVEVITTATGEYNNIKIIFNKEMNPLTVDLDIYYVVGTGTSPYIQKYSGSWASGNTEFTFDIKNVALGNTYKLVVNNSAEDANGNPLEEDYIQYFKIPL